MDADARSMREHERAVVGLWRRGHLRPGTILIYLQWVCRFTAYCEKEKLDPTEQLTLARVLRFIGTYIGRRLKGRAAARNTRNVARNALHGWACALRGLGVAVPNWRDKDAPPTLPP